MASDLPDGDRRVARGLKRRRQLLDAARDLFVEKGFRRTTLGDIIERAGGSREMIYTGFGGKHGLLGAIVADVGGAFAQYITDNDALLLPPREGLTRLGLRLLEIWRSPEGRAVHRMVASEGAEDPAILKVWYDGGARPFELALSRYLSVQVEQGRLEADDTIVLARQFHMLLLGELAYPTIAGREEGLDAAAAVGRVTDLILGAHGRSRT